MKKKLEVLGVLLFAGFSFYYTEKVSNLIRNNDPLMNEIRNNEGDMIVSKIEPVLLEDEYITGINGCQVDEKESYNKMKTVGHYKEELLVMKEDEIEEETDKYIIGGNREKRNVSIILLKNSEVINNFALKNNTKLNYFLDGEYIKTNAPKLIDISKIINIYNYGRNNSYSDKYIIYDNELIKTNFNNKSDYCLVTKKDINTLKTCTSSNMKTIKTDIIKNDILTYIKTNLTNGKIFLIDSDNYNEIKLSIKYILSKGYNIVHLDELLSTKKECNM